jgi:RecA-family ATPase
LPDTVTKTDARLKLQKDYPTVPTYTQNQPRNFCPKGPVFPDFVWDYLRNKTPEGQRNPTLFRVTQQFNDARIPIDEAIADLLPCGTRDGLSETETLKTIHQAYKYAPRQPLGGNGNGQAPPPPRPVSHSTPPPRRAASATQLPAPIPNGFRVLVENCFGAGEYVALSGIVIEPNGDRHPDKGDVSSRARWLERIAAHPINDIYHDPDGAYIRINPMQPGGLTDSDVTDFRHVLVEFDLDENGNRIPKITQYQALLSSGFPIAAIIDSGNKSLHAWIRVDAGLDLALYKVRRDIVFEHFEAFDLDPQNKNPSRYSRCPQINRALYDSAGNQIGTARQELLATGLGPASWAEWERAQKSSSFPEIISGRTVRSVHLPLPPEIIGGLLSRGEKGELAGGSKSFKTWALIQQGLSIAAGIDWWGFTTHPTNVLFLNLEIPQAFFEQRVRIVANALGIQIPDSFNIWHLRGAKLGDPARWNDFLSVLKDKCVQILNPYLTSDPIYKLLGGRNENAAGDVQTLLEQLDDMIACVDGANFFGHHYSKGNQAAKEAIDRAAGSGVFQRDPDSILTMTSHEKDSCFVIEPILRNHAPIDPFVVEWRYPLFVPNPALDPNALKQPKNKNQKYDLMLLPKWLGSDQLATKEFQRRLFNETGMSSTTFYKLLSEAEKAKLIAFDGQTKTWERCGKP